MEFRDLPPFPPRLEHQPPAPNRPERRIPTRLRRLAVNGSLAIFCLSMMFWMRDLTEQIHASPVGSATRMQPPPVEYEPVLYDTARERIRNALFKWEGDLYTLLGPPTERGLYPEEFRKWEANLEKTVFMKEGLPRYRRWDRWIDPEDPNRWFAVMYDLSRDAAWFVYDPESEKGKEK